MASGGYRLPARRHFPVLTGAFERKEAASAGLRRGLPLHFRGHLARTVMERGGLLFAGLRFPSPGEAPGPSFLVSFSADPGAGGASVQAAFAVLARLETSPGVALC